MKGTPVTVQHFRRLFLQILELQRTKLAHVSDDQGVGQVPGHKNAHFDPVPRNDNRKLLQVREKIDTSCESL